MINYIFTLEDGDKKVSLISPTLEFNEKRLDTLLKILKEEHPKLIKRLYKK